MTNFQRTASGSALAAFLVFGVMSAAAANAKLEKARLVNKLKFRP